MGSWGAGCARTGACREGRKGLPHGPHREQQPGEPRTEWVPCAGPAALPLTGRRGQVANKLQLVCPSQATLTRVAPRTYYGSLAFADGSDLLCPRALQGILKITAIHISLLYYFI